MADKYSNDFVPIEPRTLKIRGFLGIDQSGDENDLDPKYSTNAHNVDYSRSSIKCAYGVSESIYKPDVYEPTTPGAFWKPLVLHAFYQRETSGTVRKWIISVAQEAGTNRAGVWVRYVPGEDWNSPIHPEVWQKILDIPSDWAQPGNTQNHSKWNFVNYQDGDKGWLIFTSGGQDIYKWDGSYTSTTANQATKLYYVSESVHAPRGTMAALYKERVFIAGVPSLPDTLYWSNEMNPDEWTEDEANPNNAGHLDIPTWDGEGITALVPLNDELLIFKFNRLFRLSGSSPADFAITEVAKTGTGCQLNVTKWGGSAYFVSAKGLQSFDGVNLQVVADTRKVVQLQGIAENIAAKLAPSTVLVSFNNKLIVATHTTNTPSDYTDESAKSKPQVIEIDLMTGAVSFRVDQCLRYRESTLTEYNNAYLYGAVEVDYELLCSGLDTIFVYDDKYSNKTLRQYKWNTPVTVQNNGAIHMYHTVPAVDFGVASKKKRVSKITVSGKGGTIKITPICDNVVKRSITLELPAEYGVLKPKIVTWFGRKIGLRVENVDGDAVEITDIEMEYTVQGV